MEVAAGADIFSQSTQKSVLSEAALIFVAQLNLCPVAYDPLPRIAPTKSNGQRSALVGPFTELESLTLE
jgi:hypothetical protein